MPLSPSSSNGTANSLIKLLFFSYVINSSGVAGCAQAHWLEKRKSTMVANAIRQTIFDITAILLSDNTLL
jgi:hypothetical protein